MAGVTAAAVTAALTAAASVMTVSGTMALTVLSRKLGERIVVPHCELAVTIVAIEGNNVWLGISAPDDIGVYREEVWLQTGRSKATLNCAKVRGHGAGGMTET